MNAALINWIVRLVALAMILLGALGFMLGVIGLTTYHAVALLATVLWFVKEPLLKVAPKPNATAE